MFIKVHLNHRPEEAEKSETDEHRLFDHCRIIARITCRDQSPSVIDFPSEKKKKQHQCIFTFATRFKNGISRTSVVYHRSEIVRCDPITNRLEKERNTWQHSFKDQDNLRTVLFSLLSSDEKLEPENILATLFFARCIILLILSPKLVSRPNQLLSVSQRPLPMTRQPRCLFLLT